MHFLETEEPALKLSNVESRWENLSKEGYSAINSTNSEEILIQ